MSIKNETKTAQGFVIHRINFQESDRIITVLMSEFGKRSLLAKGARKQNSKLASGIEPLSLNEITFFSSNDKLSLLRSARNKKYYPNISKDYDRCQFVFEVLRVVNNYLEEGEGADVFDVVNQYFDYLNDEKIDVLLAQSWCLLQLLSKFGHTPNLESDANGVILSKDLLYKFIIQDGCFVPTETSVFQVFSANDIKAWRLLTGHNLSDLSQISGLKTSVSKTYQQLRDFFRYNFE